MAVFVSAVRLPTEPVFRGKSVRVSQRHAYKLLKPGCTGCISLRLHVGLASWEGVASTTAWHAGRLCVFEFECRISEWDGAARC